MNNLTTYRSLCNYYVNHIGLRAVWYISFHIWNCEGVAPELTIRWQQNTTYSIIDVIARLIIADDDINKNVKNNIIALQQEKNILKPKLKYIFLKKSF